MLKLVISSTTLTNISASIAGFAASVAVVKESHKGLIAIQAEKDIKMAKLFDVTVEQYKLEKEFYQKDKSSFLDKLPLLKNIKAYAKDWCIIYILKYYAGMDLIETSQDSEIVEKFNNQDWKVFDDNQLIFSGNTMHLCKY